MCFYKQVKVNLKPEQLVGKKLIVKNSSVGKVLYQRWESKVFVMIFYMLCKLLK